MKKQVITLIRLGFEPARYFKRSAWVKVERVMDYLVNIGEVVKTEGEVKYGIYHRGVPTESDLNRLADKYMKSPFIDHIEAMKTLSKESGLPLNSKELLNKFMNLR